MGRSVAGFDNDDNLETVLRSKLIEIDAEALRDCLLDRLTAGQAVAISRAQRLCCQHPRANEKFTGGLLRNVPGKTE
jgi:hypothetical protein